MSVLIHDETVFRPLLEQRRASGLDRYDEVWDGVYVMSPLANNEHQWLATQLATVLASVIDWHGLGVTLAGANVSDLRDDWTQNYRVPDVLVFLKEGSAEDCGTHWFGGPDFAIEITSPGDQTLSKLTFYAGVGTQELLVIDRDPWQLTLYRRQSATAMTPVAVSSAAHPHMIASSVLPIQVAWIDADTCIRVCGTDGQMIRELAIRFPR